MAYTFKVFFFVYPTANSFFHQRKFLNYRDHSEMAFISTFHGTTVIGRRPALTPHNVQRPLMKFGTEEMLRKYESMTRQTPTAAIPAKPSSVWRSYAQSMVDRLIPTRREMFAPKDSYEAMMDSMTSRSFFFKTPGGSPITGPADIYMAGCVDKQYKMMACANGVYGVSCTEGTTRGAADDSRTLALGARFRQAQRSTSAKFGDYLANRRYAMQACHECSYEENLVGKYPQVAAAMLSGESESKGACVRYVNPRNPAERYMMECVDKQNKFRAVPMGVYGTACQDGAVNRLAEFKRVQALAANFRAGQVGKGNAENRKFEVRKFARENFAGACSYEEDLFNRFPAVSMAMRYETARY